MYVSTFYVCHTAPAPHQRRSLSLHGGKAPASPTLPHTGTFTTLEHEVAITAAAAGKRLGLMAPVLYVYNRQTQSMEIEIVPTYLLVAMQDMYRTRVRTCGLVA